MKKGIIAGFLGIGLFCGGVGTYAGTIIDQYTTNRGTTATVEQEDVHKNRVGLEVNGVQVKTDSWYANGTTYIPLREVSNLLGASVVYEKATQSAKINSAGQKPSAPAPSALSQTINGVTVQIDKVVQDSDSLKVYVTYMNNTKEEIMTGDSLSKVVANGTQYEYDSDFNFDRWYERPVPHANDFIEPGVTEKSVIFFTPVETSTINIVLNANWEDYRFNNISVQK